METFVLWCLRKETSATLITWTFPPDLSSHCFASLTRSEYGSENPTSKMTVGIFSEQALLNVIVVLEYFVQATFFLAFLGCVRMGKPTRSGMCTRVIPEAPGGVCSCGNSCCCHYRKQRWSLSDPARVVGLADHTNRSKMVGQHQINHAGIFWESFCAKQKC
jgi:hypothetical protein